MLSNVGSLDIMTARPSSSDSQRRNLGTTRPPDTRPHPLASTLAPASLQQCISSTPSSVCLALSARPRHRPLCCDCDLHLQSCRRFSNRIREPPSDPHRLHHTRIPSHHSPVVRPTTIVRDSHQHCSFITYGQLNTEHAFVTSPPHDGTYASLQRFPLSLVNNLYTLSSPR